MSEPREHGVRDAPDYLPHHREPFVVVATPPVSPEQLTWVELVFDPGRTERWIRFGHGVDQRIVSHPLEPSMTLVRRHIVSVAVLALAMAVASPALAGGSSMPWEAPLQSILESIEGPVAKIIAVMIIIVTGLTLAFGDTSGGARRLIQIVFGLSIAFAASSFFLSFFSFGGGALV